MEDELARARAALQRASDETDDPTVREQLRSLDEGVMELVGGEKTEATPAEGDPADAGDETTEAAPAEGDPADAAVQGDRLEEVESKVVGLADETDGVTRDHLGEVRDALDAYRRKYARDW